MKRFLKDHNDQWPKSWGELKPTFDVLDRQGALSGVVTFDEFKRRVDIDFDVEVSELRQCKTNPEGPPFEVIRLQDGRDTHWEGVEPNTMIFEYLKRTSAIQ